MPTERRRATRRLIRTCEKLTARFGRALRAHDPERLLDALLALHAFVDEGIENCLRRALPNHPKREGGP